MARGSRVCAVLISLLMILTLNSGCSHGKAAVQPRAEGGRIDLTSALKEGPTLRLDGQWEFYWNALLTPEDFSGNVGREPVFIEVPGPWDKHVSQGREVTGTGFATYRLRLYTEDSLNLGLKIPRMFTACRIWVNGEPLAAAGTVGKSRSEMTPQYLPQVAFFTSRPGENELIVQVSNFYHHSGGMLESILIGSSEEIMHARVSRIAQELFLTGCLSIMGLYHFILFLFRKKDPTTLVFGTFCFFLALRTLLVGERLLIYLFPGFSWEIAHKLFTLAYYLGVPIIATFFKLVFHDYFCKKFTRLIWLISGAFSALVVLTPVRIFSVVNPTYHLFSVSAIAYMIFIFIRILKHRKPEAWLIIAGGLVIGLTSLNDIFYFSNLHHYHGLSFLRSLVMTDNLSGIGQLVFVFINSIVLAKRFSRSLESEETMTRELKTLNEDLDNLVKQRTEALEESRRELEHANRTLRLMLRKDPLTGLWNRRHYNEVIEIEWRRCLRNQKPISLMILDVDWFKEYNDRYGHVAGDECLKKIAGALEELFRRAGDLVVRYGGEEFIVLIPEAGKEEALTMAEKVQEKICRLDIPHLSSPLNAQLSVSIGVTSTVPTPDRSPGELLLTADKALYQAKGAGRNQYRFLP